MRTALARMDFAHEQAVRRWAAENRAEVKTADYGEQVLLSLEFPAALFEQLQAWCLARGISLLPSD
jgi:putative IMPACT (imprinted ancient) family translation regulator